MEKVLYNLKLFNKFFKSNDLLQIIMLYQNNDNIQIILNDVKK